jgi:uncharacterized protein (DUF362 family)
MERRAFLKMVAGYGAASLAKPATTFLAEEGTPSAYVGLHPFIEAHPEAVFIRRTKVASKTDAAGILREGTKFADLILTSRKTPGIPLTHKIAIKPNLTGTRATGLTYAIVTDPYLVEGLIGKLKLLGVPAGNIYMREGLMLDQPGLGYNDLARRSGVHYSDQESRTPTMKECPDGVVFRRTKYLGPFNSPDSWLINISKFKAHAMGLTLCVKNLQGTNIQPYIQFCFPPVKSILRDFQPDWEQHIADLHAKHERAGLPRWDTEKGAYMERWVQRTLDHYSLIRPNVGLNIIEGIYSQNGDGFTTGPSAVGGPDLYMTNLLIFGKDAFRTDIIGHWLGGHEPGNFGLFHIARERGLSTALNPRNIPVYLWEDTGPVLTPLEKFPRAPLATPYLAKADESKFHFCDETFAYSSEPASACLTGGKKPDFKLLAQQHRGPDQSSLLVEYSLPSTNHASLELFDAAGARVGILAQGKLERGIHMAKWNLQAPPTGPIYGRLLANGFEQIREICVA